MLATRIPGFWTCLQYHFEADIETHPQTVMLGSGGMQLVYGFNERYAMAVDGGWCTGTSMEAFKVAVMS